MFTFVAGVASSLYCPTLIFFSGEFIYKVSSQSPTRHFIIHSRKALLNGISPAENRSIPPLKYVLCTYMYCELHVNQLMCGYYYNVPGMLNFILLS